MEKRIKDIFEGLGVDIFGIANIERFNNAPVGFHPTDIYKDCRSVLVFAKSMPKGLAYVSPRIVYKKATDESLEEIDRISYLASVEIEKLGGFAIPLPSDSPYEYWDDNKKEGRGILSMRHAALQAGIGSMGKNTLIINKNQGNMISIGVVLTDMGLESSSLSEEICIPSCTICIDSCPQGALDGVAVNQKLCREFAYSNNARGFAVCNCNICRVACPRVFGKGIIL